MQEGNLMFYDYECDGTNERGVKGQVVIRSAFWPIRLVPGNFSSMDTATRFSAGVREAATLIKFSTQLLHVEQGHLGKKTQLNIVSVLPFHPKERFFTSGILFSTQTTIPFHHVSNYS